MKKTIAFVSLTVGAGIVGLVLLVSAWTGESSASAKQDLCNSLNDLAASVVNYEGLDLSTATNEQLDAAANDISNAWDNVVDNGNDWVNAYDNPLTNAYWDLYDSIQELPGDNTVAQDLQQLQPELVAFPQAFQETFDGSGCASA
jgi:hypothetical protein